MKRISYILIALTLCLSYAQADTLSNLMSSFKSHDKSICGSVDDRELSQVRPIARIRQVADRAGCTVTMIGRTCAVSAGHCVSTFGIAEFNTPPSADGSIQLPSAEDTYLVDATTTVSRNGGQGQDWAVVRILPNEITGAFPGDAQGYYGIAQSAPAISDIIRITGYGAANGADRNFAQQTHLGEITGISRSGVISHVADTMGGNSGSSIILESTQEIVGIHSHGGCWSRGGANAGTLLASNTEFKTAIAACLAWEDDNL